MADWMVDLSGMEGLGTVRVVSIYIAIAIYIYIHLTKSTCAGKGAESSALQFHLQRRVTDARDLIVVPCASIIPHLTVF